MSQQHNDENEKVTDKEESASTSRNVPEEEQAGTSKSTKLDPKQLKEKLAAYKKKTDDKELPQNRKPYKPIMRVETSTDETPSSNIEPRKSNTSEKQVKFDEENIKQTYKPEGRDYGLMKIDEPVTPYASYDSLTDDDEVVINNQTEDKYITTVKDGEVMVKKVPKEKAEKKFDMKRSEHYRGEFPKNVPPIDDDEEDDDDQESKADKSKKRSKRK